MIDLDGTETGWTRAVHMVLRKRVLFWMGKDFVPRFFQKPLNCRIFIDQSINTWYPDVD